MNCESKVQDWLDNKGISKYSTPEDQATKLIEELNEFLLEVESEEQDIEKIKLEGGDILVSLKAVIGYYNLTLEDCLEAAYLKIKDRTGHLNEYGVFVKDGD